MSDYATAWLEDQAVPYLSELPLDDRFPSRMREKPRKRPLLAVEISDAEGESVTLYMDLSVREAPRFSWESGEIEANCTIRLDENTLRDLQQGEESFHGAFATRRLTVDGRVQLATLLRDLLKEVVRDGVQGA